MKKNRCPPYSTGCEAGKVHLDIAVPGYDDLRYSTGNVCHGDPAGWNSNHGRPRENTFGMTRDSSSSCSLWYNGHGSTQTGCDCNRVTADYGLKAGCQLFTEWGWKAAPSHQLNYKIVDCPAKFKAIIANAFSANGPSAIAVITTATTTPSSCAAMGTNCRSSKCCVHAALTCYEKNPYWASCKASCNPGIDYSDPVQHQTPWSCTPLSTPATTTTTMTTTTTLTTTH